MNEQVWIAITVAAGFFGLIAFARKRAATLARKRDRWKAQGILPYGSEPTLENVRALVLEKDPDAFIEAIRAYRVLTGMGLKESKDACEALRRGEDPVAAATGSHEMPAEVLKLIEQYLYMDAIKLYRELTGAGLKEAKDAVEARIRK